MLREAMTALKEQLGQYEIKNVQGLSDKESKIEGAGSYGTVYKVTVNGVPRIAKQLHHALIDSDVSPDQKKSIQQRFYQECLLLSGLDHPNIVEFIGVYFDPKCRDVNLSLIMEQLHTDLDKFINQETHPKIPISIKVSILLDVSYGLLYLHSKRPEAIIHRDLTSPNILLTKDLRAKITDLGVSKLLNIKPATQTKCPGTLAYMPPEALRQNPVYGTELDIFSFGQVCLCVGVQSFAEPFDYSNKDADMIADFASRKELHILKRKVWINQLQGPNACFREMIYSCLQDDPAKRPTAKQVSSIMKILCAHYPKSPADLAAVWDGPTVETADLQSQTEPEKIKHLQEQLIAAKEAGESLRSAKKSLEEELEMKKTENDILQDKYCIVRTEADLYKEDFETERNDREKAHSKAEEMREGFTRSLQVMNKNLEHVTLERNHLIERLKVPELSTSDARMTETTPTSTMKTMWGAWKKRRTRTVSEFPHSSRMRSERVYISDLASSAAPQTTNCRGFLYKTTDSVVTSEDQSVDTSPEMARPAFHDVQGESDQPDSHSASYSEPQPSTFSRKLFTADAQDDAHVPNHMTDEKDHVTNELDYVNDDQDHVTDKQDHVTDVQDHVTDPLEKGVDTPNSESNLICFMCSKFESENVDQYLAHLKECNM